MKKLLKSVAYVILGLIIAFAVFLTYATLADYRPEPVETIAEAPGTGDIIKWGDTLNVFNWNIGYAGLGDDMSFFYDGGEKVRTTKERTAENFKAIIQQISQADTMDFYLFQEIDKKSKRSYKVDQFFEIKNILTDFNAYFATNYKVAFVPIPPTRPMGGVLAGIGTYSKPEPYLVNRHSFIGNYTWPKGLFMLDRCYMVQRFKTSNNKELLIINTHNSAYDDGSLRTQQMEKMREFLLSEYKKGNFILVGGDWNQLPPKKGEKGSVEKDKHLTRIRIAEDFMPQGWNWLYNENIPTNRMLYETYNPETTNTAVIDFYLLSPNLKALGLKNIDLQFKHSDHQPVLLSFTFARK